MRTRSLALAVALVTACGGCGGCAGPAPNRDVVWNPDSAARYLDRRADWWMEWRDAKRDRGTFCISCHTALPYALASPALRERTGSPQSSARENALFENVRTRVRHWKEVSPYYSAHDRQSEKATESRATEAVLNALILATADARTGRLCDDTRLAFDHMWTLQRQDGSDAGAWRWLQFRLEPWEGQHGEYYGAALAALAIGIAPGHYASEAAIRARVERLRGYLDREFGAQPLSNRAVLLWASAALPGLVSDERRASIAADLRAARQRDGGWSLRRFNGGGSWWDPRRFIWPSDGYATGLAVLALDATGGEGDPAVRRGLTWLATHQRSTDGSWQGYSLNGLEPASPGVARFMDDAATAYAVLALVEADARVHVK